MSQTTSTVTLPWFGPNNWYMLTDQGGTGLSRKLVYSEGDFNAMFEPGAQWDPSKIGVLIMGDSDIMMNPGHLPQLVAWFNAHPQVKLAWNESMLAVGPNSGCVSNGGRAALPLGTPLTKGAEGVDFVPTYPNPNYPPSHAHALTTWYNAGGRIDIVMMDTPLTAGINRCGFTTAQTVSALLPFAQLILKLYPHVQFALEQGPNWTDSEWIDYTLQFFREFARQVGVPVSYANLDMHLDKDFRVPPTPLYTTNGVTGTINRAVDSFNAAGVKTGLNINAGRKPGMTQAQWISQLRAYQQQAINSGVPFDHLEIDPFAGQHIADWVVDNMPDTSCSTETSLLLPPSGSCPAP